MALAKYEYFDKYDENDFPTKGKNRDKKIDKRAKANQDFMKINGQGLKSTILPLLRKKAKEAKDGKRK